MFLINEPETFGYLSEQC